ncbi:MAG: DUF1015 family protein [Peptococcaceae bacterium]|jgi:uncharacterized protein (DUF1015 family)|nr:DUF1015 family protein [Peptococcaceae bacterium]
MAVVRPFKAIRPTPDLARKVAALPYDVMSSDEAREMSDGNPYTFLHVDKAEIDLDKQIDLYDPQVYEQASKNLNQMIADGIFSQENSACLYIYRQVMDGRPQTGLVGCTSIDDYLANAIKKHELTRADKEQDRIRHVDICDANTGPIFLTYRAQAAINNRVNQWMEQHDAVYDFISDDGIGHTVWIIDDPAVIAALTDAFARVESLYIADGHHRSASAVQVGLKRREQFPDYDGNEEFNFFLSVLFPDEQLYIMDYNRVVRDLNGLTVTDFLERVKERFLVQEHLGKEPFKPEQKHTFGMYLHAKWYKLTAKEGSYDPKDPVGRLDVSIMQNNLLQPILGIEDPRKDKRIDFIGGIRGLRELEKRVTSGMKVAFSLYPTTVEDLMSIADAGAIMPPKSTWFEPKLRSGIFIHALK